MGPPAQALTIDTDLIKVKALSVFAVGYFEKVEVGPAQGLGPGAHSWTRPWYGDSAQMLAFGECLWGEAKPHVVNRTIALFTAITPIAVSGNVVIDGVEK